MERAASGGERRGASQREAELDISPNTLSTRLDEFETAGLITRTQDARTQDEEIPPRVEYEATERARALDGVFRELRD